MTRIELAQEAEGFGRHLLGRAVDKSAVDLYIRVMHKPTLQISAGDRRLLAHIRRHPRHIAWVDAYLALFEPGSEVRRRLFIMFAILEANPLYHDLFLPKRRSAWYLLVLAGCGLRAACRVLPGIVVVRTARSSG